MGSILMVITIALTTMSVPRTSAGDSVAVLEERQVKAAFLFNFTKFVEWPGPTEGPFLIGVAGDDEFAGILESVVRGRTAKGRELVVRRLLEGDDPSNCQVLYISGSKPRDAIEMLQRASGAILTVGETPSFLRDGGMVRFRVDDRHIRFEIHQKNATTRGLKISSHLLTLAAR